MDERHGAAIDELRDRLLKDAFLYDEPACFIAGVDAALRTVLQLSQLGGAILDVTDVTDVTDVLPAAQEKTPA